MKAHKQTGKHAYVRVSMNQAGRWIGKQAVRHAMKQAGMDTSEKAVGIQAGELSIRGLRLPRETGRLEGGACVLGSRRLASGCDCIITSTTRRAWGLTPAGQKLQ